MAKHPQWAIEYKRKGTELRLIKGTYYLYKVTSKWNPEKKRSQKHRYIYFIGDDEHSKKELLGMCNWELSKDYPTNVGEVHNVF